MPKNPSFVYQIKVTLDDTHPPIWRRILVPESTTLLKLHDILQIVMGWEDYHLHQFLVDDQYFGNPEDDEYGDLGTLDEKRVKLKDIVPGEDFRFKYEYDFGDSWYHTLLVEKVLPPEEGVHYPVCVKGKRACPPEDVGGVWGYENFLDAIDDPDHDEHNEYLEWIGGEFDPDAFDLEEVNQRLHAMGRGRSVGRNNAWEVDEETFSSNQFDLGSSWAENLPPNQIAIADALPLRRDTLTFLTYLRDHRPAGTQSTGNLPLKAVREITSRFVNPPLLDEPVGDQIFHLRSETDVWPLYFLHILSTIGGLAEGGPGRRWKLTSLGEQFLDVTPPVQVWHLFKTWWTRVNWEIAYPFELGGEGFTSYFARVVLDDLRVLPSGKFIPFAVYADELIKKTGLTWHAQDQSFARIGLHFVIRMMVVNPLTSFGVLEVVLTPSESGSAGYRELNAIKVTEFGMGILAEIDKEVP